MNTRTQAALLDSAIQGQQAALWSGKPISEALPLRDVEGEAVNAWIAVDRLSTAPSEQLQENLTALIEMRDRLNAMIGGE